MRTLTVLFAIFAASLVPIGGASDDSADARRAALDAARGVWASNGATDYDMVFERRCFCTEDYRGPFRVRVRDGAVDSATFTEGNSNAGEDVPLTGGDSLLTVEGLFKMIETGIGQDYAKLDVAYDDSIGFPTRIDIDVSEMIADDERTFLVSEYDADVGRRDLR